jgi:hypothetical protein
MLSVFMLNAHFIYCYAACHCAERRYAVVHCHSKKHRCRIYNTFFTS